jgi:hypothetical protein
MSGGQRVDYYIHSKWHLNWKKLNVHVNDCGANCFSMLGYSNLHTSNEIARRTRNGLSLAQIIDMLNDGYGDGHEWLQIKALSIKLPINQATIAYIAHTGEPMGHFFIIVRTDINEYIAIDAQFYKQMPLEDYYRLFNSPDLFFFISSPTVLTQYNRVTMNIVNKHLPKPTPTPTPKTPKRRTRTRRTRRSQLAKKIQWLVKSEV